MGGEKEDGPKSWKMDESEENIEVKLQEERNSYRRNRLEF